MGKINLLPVILAFTVSALASNFSIEFFSSIPKVVDLTIESVDTKTGDFSGEATGRPGEIWEVIGTVIDGKVEIEFSNIKNSKRILATGEIQKDGAILGKAATEEGELFEWEATDATKKA